MKIRDQLARARALRAQPKPFDAKAEREAERAEKKADRAMLASGREPCACGRPHETRCAFPLRGPKAGQTCGRPLCERHVFEGYCVTHDGIRKREGT